MLVGAASDNCPQDQHTRQDQVFFDLIQAMELVKVVVVVVVVVDHQEDHLEADIRSLETVHIVLAVVVADSFDILVDNLEEVVARMELVVELDHQAEDKAQLDWLEVLQGQTTDLVVGAAVGNHSLDIAVHIVPEEGNLDILVDNLDDVAEEDHNLEAVAADTHNQDIVEGIVHLLLAEVVVLQVVLGEELLLVVQDEQLLPVVLGEEQFLVVQGEELLPVVLGEDPQLVAQGEELLLEGHTQKLEAVVVLVADVVVGNGEEGLVAFVVVVVVVMVTVVVVVVL